MNKNAIKKFAIDARNKLIASVTDKAGMLGITPDNSSSFINFCFISARNLSISCSVSIEYVLAPATLLIETFLRLFVFTLVGTGAGAIGSLPGTTGATGGSGAG